MKKLITILSVLFLSSSLFALSLTPSLNYEATETNTPIYLELDLVQEYEVLSLGLVFDMGYDYKTKGAYDNLLLKSSLNFDWGYVEISQEIGTTPTTKIKVSL